MLKLLQTEGMSHSSMKNGYKMMKNTVIIKYYYMCVETVIDPRATGLYPDVAETHNFLVAL